MKLRWAPAFTIVEILIIIVVIAILATISIIGYNTVTRAATTRIMESNLHRVSTEMQRLHNQNGEYPTTLPPLSEATDDITLVVIRSGQNPFYTDLSSIQQGVLISQICQNLIDEGTGKGTDQGGEVQDYLTGCGNWNDDSMQLNGWDTKKWDTPVTKNQLLQYASSYTVSNSFHKTAQEKVVKTFYGQLVTRHEAQGGSFPITSFWDYWATPTNGGVQNQPLSSNPKTKPYYCVEARAKDNSGIIMHVTEESKILSGSC